MFKLICLVVIITISNSELIAGQLFNKRLNYKIIIQDNPTKIQTFAATELDKFLTETYSKPILLNGKNLPLTFMIGFPQEAMLVGFDKIPTMTNKFGIFRQQTNFLFYGADRQALNPRQTYKYQSGTLSAVYYFINHYLHTEFYFPGNKGYLISRNQPLEFKTNIAIPKPTFEVRGIALYTKEYSQGDLNIFFRRSLGNNPYWSKYDYYYIFWKKWQKRFSKTHPEYFSLHNGKRVSENYPRHAPCFSNQNALHQVAADIIGEINRHPEIETVRVFCDAPISLCNCKKCLDAKERPFCGGDIQNGEAVYGYLKKVMDLVHEAHPKTHFYTQTKGMSYSQPPQLVKLGADFTVKLLTDHELSTYDPTAHIALAKAWKKQGAKVLLKCYPRYPAFKDYPIIKPHLDQQYFKNFTGIIQGTDDSDLREYVPYAFVALGQYLQLKMLFNINIDLNREIAKFCKFAYPGAEVEMIAFYAKMEQLFAKNRSLVDNMFIHTYYPDKLVEPMQLLEQAAKKVDPQSPYFPKLFTSFKKFYQQAQQAKAKIDLIIAASPLKTLAIPLLKIDNKFKLLEPADWHGALHEKLFAANSYSQFQPSNIYLGCSKDKLYIGLVAAEIDTKALKQTYKINGQGALWRDDCFEVMLVPNNKSKVYYQIIANSLGTYRVFKCKTGSRSVDDKEFKVNVSAKINKNSWTISFEIPLTQFAGINFDQAWKFNIFRTRYLTHPVTGNRQSSGLRLLGGSYHDLNSYDYITWPRELKQRQQN
jgi:hypothetical protein